MILRYLFTNAFFCRNVLRANILAMLRFQSVVTVSLLNKIKFYNHNAVTMWVCVCFFIEQNKSNAQVYFFLFYRHSLETRKVVIWVWPKDRAQHLVLDISSQDDSYFFTFLDASFQATTGIGNSMLFSWTHELSWKYIYM